jgi:NAD(P)-dependent dehydrogenase (short-subunit alcohol dehydrogenase family)
VRHLVAMAEGLGGVDVLVNNAGGWGGSPLQYPDAAPEDWSAVLDLNLHAPHAPSSAFPRGDAQARS